MGLAVAVAMVLVQWLCRGYPESSVAVAGAPPRLSPPGSHLTPSGALARGIYAESRARDPTAAAAGYFAAFLFSMFALNVLAAAASGLIPDIVRCGPPRAPPHAAWKPRPDPGAAPRARRRRDQVGQANGVMAALMAGGACAGFLFSFFNKDQNHLYALYVVLALVRGINHGWGTGRKPSRAADPASVRPRGGLCES